MDERPSLAPTDAWEEEEDVRGMEEGEEATMGINKLVSFGRKAAACWRVILRHECLSRRMTPAVSPMIKRTICLV